MVISIKGNHKTLCFGGTYLRAPAQLLQNSCPLFWVSSVLNTLTWESVPYAVKWNSPCPFPLCLWTATGNNESSSSFSRCIQLSSRADTDQHSHLALMDGMLTFHKIRDTGCSGDNKIQMGLFQRATQSRFCSWVT